jgi:tetratricopeptide (TPR) repeat protein
MFESAIKNINQSLELKRDWEIPYFYRAVAYQALEQFDEAMLDYTKALQINPNMTDAYYNRAYINLTRKDISNQDLEKTLQDLQKAIELDPKFIDALYAMAAALKKQERYQDCLSYLDRVLELQPDFIYAKALKKLILQKYL